MGEKTVADLWDAIKGLRDDIASLQDRIDGIQESREIAFDRHEETHAREALRRAADVVFLEERIERLELSQ